MEKGVSTIESCNVVEPCNKVMEASDDEISEKDVTEYTVASSETMADPSDKVTQDDRPMISEIVTSDLINDDSEVPASTPVNTRDEVLTDVREDPVKEDPDEGEGPDGREDSTQEDPDGPDVREDSTKEDPDERGIKETFQRHNSKQGGRTNR